MKVNIAKSFEKHLDKIYKKHKSLLNDLEKLIESLEENPIQGSHLGKKLLQN
jgi:mRNA-degrading endonuclease YafQ of YafQ-DinJ toxin-antitoxin module